MSTETSGGRRSQVTRWVLIGAAVVIVVSLALTFWPRGTSTPAATNSPVAVNTPAVTPTPDPFVTPVPPTSTTKPQKSASFIPHSRKPVALAAKTTVVDGLTLKITSVASVAGVAIAPGDVSGPSIQVRMLVTNSTSQSVTLSNVVVNAYYGADHKPASPLPKPGGRAFPSVLAAGKSATGVFVFSIPKDLRKLVTISFDYSVKTTVVVFQGSAPS
jgi:hypothetical protein